MVIGRRKFTLGFRADAAQRVIDTGRNRRAGPSDSYFEAKMLSKKVRDFCQRREAHLALSDNSLTVAERVGLQRLRREVRELQKGSRFLKKQPRTSRRIPQSREIFVDARGARGQ